MLRVTRRVLGALLLLRHVLQLDAYPREEILTAKSSIGSLGFIEIATADYVRQADNGEYEINDVKKPLSEPLRLKESSKGKLNFTVAFYPTLNLVDPEEDESEKRDGGSRAPTTTSSQPNIDLPSEKVLENGATGANGHWREPGKIEANISRELSESEKEQQESVGNKLPPKLRLTPEELSRYGKSVVHETRL